MYFWRTWNNNWRIRFFSNNKQQSSFFSCSRISVLLHFLSLSFFSIWPFFSSFELHRRRCFAFRFAFLTAFLSLFTLIQYFKVTFDFEARSFSSLFLLTVLWISYERKLRSRFNVFFFRYLCSLETSLT